MANPNPKAGPGRPKGCRNKTPILLQELESIIFELSKEERIRRLRAYRDFSQVTNPHRNFVTMHMAVAKTQEANGQADLFDSAETAAMIARAEQKVSNMQRTETTQ
jgi:hypothetical protein